MKKLFVVLIVMLFVVTFIDEVSTQKKSSQLKRLPDLHSKTIIGLATYPEGKMFATSDKGGTVLLRKEGDGSLIRPLKAVEWHSYTGNLQFSNDGKLLGGISGVDRYKSYVDVWNTQTGERVHSGEIKSQEPCITLDFDHTGKRIAVGGVDGVIRIITLEAKKQLPEIHIEETSWISNVYFRKDGKSLLVACVDGIYTYDLETGESVELFSPIFQMRRPKMVDETSLVIEDKELRGSKSHFRIWDAEKGVETAHFELPLQEYSVRGITKTKNGEVLVAAGNGLLEKDKPIFEIWNATTGKKVFGALSHDVFHDVPIGRPSHMKGDWIDAGEFSPDGRQFLWRSRSGRIGRISINL